MQKPLQADRGPIRTATMEKLKRLKIKRFVTDHAHNPYPEGELPWRVWR
jgi:hypothetical protein